MAENIKWVKIPCGWESEENLPYADCRGYAVYFIWKESKNKYGVMYRYFLRNDLNTVKSVPLPDMGQIADKDGFYKTLKDAKQACDTFQHHYRFQGGWE